MMTRLDDNDFRAQEQIMGRGIILWAVFLTALALAVVGLLT
jgi:hypothetical protein